MRVAFAYVVVVAIWATTPLAIKWSGGEVGFVFAATARMSIGALCLLLAMPLARQHLPLHGKAWQTYAAVALQLYASLLLTYWCTQYLPSGWVSVIFGLSPLMTAPMAAFALNEASLGWGKLSAYLLGVAGLVLMFQSALALPGGAIPALVGMLLSVLLQSAGSVWVKRIDAGLPAMTQVSGGLLLSLPLYLATWYAADGGAWPPSMTPQTLWSILYLGLLATPLGLVLYYFLLIHLSATSVALITLITPPLSLLLGYSVNHEPMTWKIIVGTGLILLALALHSLANRRPRVG
ncbi:MULTISPECIES: DMT family transporter [Methylomonas]|uniref:DMT family transporter n=1 Tax=Methylomonas TaxID=416 RepID=UPI001232BAC4|nr:DMT family transporter [Methylomonas rhizoryzae]